MPCSNHTGEYHSYNCYKQLKYLFGKSKLSSDGENFFNKVTEQVKEVSQFTKEKNNIFRDLARYLTADDAFLTHWYHISCMYINFWLNEQVKNSYNDKYKSNFHLFGNFARIFAKERRSDGYPENSCENYIKKLDGDKYHKKQILYKLYDLYTQHKKPKNDRTTEKLCNIINLIRWESSEAKNYIEQDKIFEKQIRELKDLIQREKPHKDTCKNYNILNFMLPEVTPPPQVKTPDFPVVKSTSPVSLPITQHENLEHVEGDIRRKAQAVLPETVELPKESKLQEEESLTAMTPSQTLQEQLSFRVSQEGDPLDKRISQEDPLLRTLHQEARPLKQERELTQTDYHLLGVTPHARSDSGVLGSIQNTLTDVLGSVEPAPILGVSGGMGALFLLFKYTPVGTFFRGRRGRTYGIPSGFNIPFQGGLQGYEDYYSGNVGSDRFHVSYQAE
ncbi:PIR protein [Plasmodium vivax]|nr:PIR protein [Plasmodium vivax]